MKPYLLIAISGLMLCAHCRRHFAGNGTARFAGLKHDRLRLSYEVIKVFLYPTPELPDDTPLECVRFSTRIRNALEFGGLKTVGEVRTASDAVLLSFQGLGRGSVQHLRQTLGPSRR